MTTVVQTTNILTDAASDHAIELVSGDTAYIMGGVTVAARGINAAGISGLETAGLGSAFVYGTVISDQSYGIQFSRVGEVYVVASGAVIGATGGIETSGDNAKVIIDGDVTSTGILASAVKLSGGNQFVSVGTEGTVTGFVGLQVDITAPSTNRIYNAGNIIADGPYLNSFGVNVLSETGQLLKMINEGRISAAAVAVKFLDGNETLINRAYIDGDVQLGGGNDVYRGVLGEVEGIIQGEAGSDLLVGGSQVDMLSGGSGNDILRGGAGDDILTGGTGRDVLTGGEGADAFNFDAINEIGSGAASDRVTDFLRTAGDTIDVSTIDANSSLAGNQQFDFLTGLNAAFTAAGQIRYRQMGDNTYIDFNTDSDLGTVDATLQVTGLIAFKATDFEL